MKFLVLLNESAGTLAGMQPAEAQKQIAEGFAAAGAVAEVRFIDMRFVDRHVREAAQTDIDALIAGGGDGTLNSIANALASAGRKPFGVLPLGTYNHLAKDLGVPLELNDAVKALANGTIEELPVGELNGRIFLSFAALGLHPEMVCEREEERRRSGRGKFTAMMLAWVRVLWRPPIQYVRLSTRGRTIAAHASSIVVCNNEYQIKAMGLAAASVPERGLLNVYLATAPKTRNIVWLLLRAFVAGLRRSTPHFHAMALPDIRVDTRRHHRIRLSLDGELMKVRPPLTFRIRATPLRVLKPRKAES